MAQSKPEEIKVRVSREMKRRVLELAEQRGEGESMIVREALALYLSRRGDISRPEQLSGAVALHEGTSQPALEEEAAEVMKHATEELPEKKASRAHRKAKPGSQRSGASASR